MSGSEKRSASSPGPAPPVEQLRLIAENVTDIVWLGRIEGLAELARGGSPAPADFDADAFFDRFEFTWVSPSVEQVLGYRADEMMRLRPRDFLAPASYEATKQRFGLGLKAALEDPEFVGGEPVELEHVAKDGRSCWCEQNVRFLRDEDGALAGLLGVARDVTERRRARAAVERSEAKLQRLFESHPDFVLVVDRDARILYVNRDAPTVSRQDLIGTVGFSHVDDEHRAAAREAFEKTLSTGTPQTVEVRTVYGAWWDCRLVPVDHEDESPAVMIVCMDVTRRRRAEEALRAEQQKLRQLLEFQERERRMTAFEIHDGFVQLATGALMNFQAFDGLGVEDPQQAQQTFERGLQLLASSVGEARRLIGGLRPPVLDESGVVAAVDHLLAELESCGGPETEFAHDPGEIRLPRELETTVFRIIQEAVNNVQRHSQSSRLRVRLGAEHGHVVVEVEDWGVGLGPGAVDESRFGLKGIRERARLLSGSAEVESRRGEGTRIVVRLPLWPETGAPRPE